MTPPPLLPVGPGQLGIRPIEACSPPGGVKAWMSQLITAVGLPQQPFVARELEAVAADIATGPDMTWSPPASEIQCIPTRLARVRYRFLAMHYERGRKVVYETGAPDDPSLRALWERSQRARAAEEAQKRRLALASKKATDTWADYVEAQMAAHDPAFAMAAARRGAKGNPHHREPVRALVRIYRDVFGVEPRRSDEGPMVRFVAAFFRDLEGTWFWLRIPLIVNGHSGRS